VALEKGTRLFGTVTIHYVYTAYFGFLSLLFGEYVHNYTIANILKTLPDTL